MAPEPTISVVITTYQRKDYVVRAVGCVLEQEHAPLETIVVDDGSTDGTESALRIFGSQIRFLRKRNGGVGSARNAGIRAARGELVAFLEDDDRWLPSHLSVIVEAFTRFPEAVAASTCPGFGFGRLMFASDPELVEPLPRLLIGSFVGFPSCTAARREAVITAGYLDEGLRALQAYDLCLRLARLGRFVFARRHTVIRETLSDSLGRREVRDGQRLDALGRIADKAERSLAPLSSPIARATASHRTFVGALRAFDRGDLGAASEALADACRLMPERLAEPWLAGGWLSAIPRASTTDGRISVFCWAARSWPEPGSPAALGVRLHAAYLAWRARRVRLAIELLTRAPRWALLSFVLRELSPARGRITPSHAERSAPRRR